MKNQEFSQKVFSAVVIFFLARIVFIAIYSNNITSDVVLSLGIFFVLLLVIFWNDATNKNNISNGGGNITVEDKLFQRLHQKYRDLAEKYEQENNHKKAAQVYMKLLNSLYEAAEVLERGKFYNEAAVIYHKKLHHHPKAAECYENGKNYDSAIKLYTELHQHEKLGDVYTKMNKPDAAMTQYRIVVDDYKKNNQFLKGALVLRNKMNKTEEAQDLLFQGWTSGYDSKNCLHQYFSHIEDNELLAKEIQHIYQNHCDSQQLLTYLELLKTERTKHQSLEKPTRDIAYEIISKTATTNKKVLDQLTHFKPNDHLVKKDVVKYRARK